MKSRGRSSSWIICWKAKRKFIRRRRTTTWASPPPTRIVSVRVIATEAILLLRTGTSCGFRQTKSWKRTRTVRCVVARSCRRSMWCGNRSMNSETIRVGGGLAQVVVLLRRMNFLFAFQQIIQEEDRPRLFISNPIEWNRRAVRELDQLGVHGDRKNRDQIARFSRVR